MGSRNLAMVERSVSSMDYRFCRRDVAGMGFLSRKRVWLPPDWTGLTAYWDCNRCLEYP